MLASGKAYGPVDLDVDGELRVVLALPIQTASRETIGAFVVSRSRDEETAAFREIRNTLLAVGLGAVLLAIPLSFGVGHRIGKPVQQLAAVAQRIRDGHLEVEIPTAGSGEVGALAHAFAEMVEELQEKAALEQLVAEFQRRPGDDMTRIGWGSCHRSRRRARRGRPPYRLRLRRPLRHPVAARQRRHGHRLSRPGSGARRRRGVEGPAPRGPCPRVPRPTPPSSRRFVSRERSHTRTCAGCTTWARAGGCASSPWSTCPA